MDSEENKDLEIVMVGNSDLEISEVGDMINDLKPSTSKEKKSIINPISMKKSQNVDNNKNENETDDTEATDNDSDKTNINNAEENLNKE